MRVPSQMTMLMRPRHTSLKDSQYPVPQTHLTPACSNRHPGVEGNRRLSLTPGGTTKVLADLQTGVINARNALENTKAQLRLSQRSVAQLTRQTEDLKEVRERLRLENEGLNNVVARKERLLQEVRFGTCVKETPPLMTLVVALEQARKAEAEAVPLKARFCKSEPELPVPTVGLTAKYPHLDVARPAPILGPRVSLPCARLAIGLLATCFRPESRLARLRSLGVVTTFGGTVARGAWGSAVWHYRGEAAQFVGTGEEGDGWQC
jgi:hypothetical protein